VHYLFLTHQRGIRGTALALIDRGTDLLIYALLLLWGLRTLRSAVNYFRYATQKAQWPAVDPIFITGLWAGLALAFHFALPLLQERYATSVVVFAWPALVAEVDRRNNALFWLSLAVIGVMSLTQGSYYMADMMKNWDRIDNTAMRKSMRGTLRQAPAGIRQIYVLSAGGLPYANPKYISPLFGVPAEIVRLIELDWHRCDASDLVAFNHSTIDGIVSLTVTLPNCATFLLNTKRLGGMTNGRLYRNNTISYELPDAQQVASARLWQPGLFLGRTMIVRVRPNGPARFVIERGGPNGIAWFDTP
jgi:hypothetical protein